MNSSSEGLAGAKKRGGGDAENFSGTTAEDQLLGLDGMRLGNSVVEGVYRQVWIAIRKVQSVLHGGDYFLRRALVVFVAAQND
jgi:hypothetical protein